MQKFLNEESGFRDLGFSISDLFRISNFEFRIFPKRGFSLLEVLLALGIIAIISAISVASLSNMNKDRALGLEADKVLSLLSKARSNTIAAKDGSVFGVHFEERKIVLFMGSTYNAGAAANETQSLNDAVKVASVSLAGGGSDVVFKKLSGATTHTGALRLTLVGNANASTTITIAGTGIAYSN